MAVVCLGTSALHSKELAKAHMVLLLQVRPPREDEEPHFFKVKLKVSFIDNSNKCTKTNRRTEMLFVSDPGALIIKG
jgi:hypothetical protein